MLSLANPFTAFPLRISCASRHIQVRSLVMGPIKSSSENGNTTTSSDDGNASPPSRSRITPPDTVEIRFRRGSRQRRKQQQDAKITMNSRDSTPKDWDSMSLTEKAIEFYMGEKGLLFWLNKFAYASIFIIIGGWILFRFVGPSLNLYQLDTPPLAPTSMFKGQEKNPIAGLWPKAGNTSCQHLGYVWYTNWTLLQIKLERLSLLLCCLSTVSSVPNKNSILMGQSIFPMLLISQILCYEASLWRSNF